jgi:Tol biopolymer transport system component
VRKVLDDARPFDAGADSTAIVRVPRETGRLEVVSLASGRPMRAILLSDSIGPIREVSWSPDGRWVAFIGARDRQLWTVGVDGGTPNRVASDARRVRWAPSSDAVYFLRGAAGAVDLIRARIDTTTGRTAGAPARVTSLLAADAFDVSANGRLVHTQATPSAPALTFMLGGSPRRAVEEHPLREGTARVDAATVSPDGRWVAYSAGQGAQQDIHVVAFGGGSARILTDSRGRDFGPAWSPDGTRLTYTHEDSAGRRLMIADARTGIAQRSGSLPGPAAGEVVTAARWSASGRHIAYYADDLRRIAFINLQRRTESMVRVPEYVGRGYFAVVPSPNGTQLIATTKDSAEADPLIWLVFGNGRRWRQINGPAGETLPIAWHRNGWIYVVRNRGVATEHGAAHVELWRMRGPTGRAELYAALPQGCGMSVSISADATRGVCNYVRVESDLYVASSIGNASR